MTPKRCVAKLVESIETPEGSLFKFQIGSGKTQIYIVIRASDITEADRKIHKIIGDKWGKLC